MKLRILKPLAVFATVLSASAFCATAFADETADLTITEEVPQMRKTSIEILPATTLLSATPGVASFGAAIESRIDNKWAGFFEGAVLNANLQNKVVNTAKDNTNEPVPAEVKGFSTGLGLRYYEDPIGNSFYGAGSLTYSEAKGTWELNDSVTESEAYTVTPAIAAGYRWIWTNGMVVRLGAGAGMPSIQSDRYTATTETKDSPQALEKVKDIQRQTVTAKLDLGVGYAF